MEPTLGRPDPAVPASWSVGSPYVTQAEAALPAVTYKQIFTDVRLQTLIVEALANNRDLMIAASNIAAAREQFRVQRADQLPQLNAGAGVTVTGDKTKDVSAQYQAGLNVPSFDIDLFGRLRSLTHAQLQHYLATEAAARATRLSLVAEIAGAWLDYAADSEFAAGVAANRRHGAKRASASPAFASKAASLRGPISARPRKSLVRRNRPSRSNERCSRRTSMRCSCWSGRPLPLPCSRRRSSRRARPSRELPAGLSSTVLLRRPDVLQAEYQLRAANADIGAARAALFPKITLTGLLGFASSALTSLFTGGAFAWSAGANAAYTIFNGGAGRAGVRLSEAQRNAALASYQRAVQTAFREVADALPARRRWTTSCRRRSGSKPRPRMSSCSRRLATTPASIPTSTCLTHSDPIMPCSRR